MTERLKVLVSAYACSPCKGSEPGVGWGFVHALARHHDLWVIVEEEKFRADIERYVVKTGLFDVGAFPLAEDETLRHRLAQGAVRRARDFSWEGKADVLDRIYHRVMADSRRGES